MNLDKFNLNLFVALDAVLHAGSLTEAARTLHLSQPALSIALKKLRETYGDEIVVYTSGEPVLTALGRALQPRIKALIQQAKDALKLELDFDPATAHQTLRIMSPDVLELLFLRSVYVDIAREAPDITILSQGFSYQPLEWIMNTDVDLVIVADAFVSDRYAHEPLFTETFSCMVWEGNTKVGETLSAEEYLALSHADLNYGPREMPTQPAFDHLREISRRRKVRLQTSMYSTLPHMIVGTELVVTALTRYAQWCAARLPIRVLPYPFAMPPVQFIAQWQPYRNEDPALLWLRNKLRRVAANFSTPHPAAQAFAAAPAPSPD